MPRGNFYMHYVTHKLWEAVHSSITPVWRRSQFKSRGEAAAPGHLATDWHLQNFNPGLPDQGAVLQTTLRALDDAWTLSKVTAGGLRILLPTHDIQAAFYK